VQMEWPAIVMLVLSYLLRHKEFVDSQRVSEKLKKD